MTAASQRVRRSHRLAGALCAAALSLPTLARAATLGNLSYSQAELEHPISLFGGEGPDKFPTGPTGSNTVLVLHGYMIVMGSYDSGKPPGSFHVFDISDPRKPNLLHTLDGTPETSKLRELHAMPVAMLDGKDFLVVPSTAGLQFFDFTDPLNPKPSGAITLSGVNGGDYDNAAWMLSWAWPYVYVGGTGNGVYIVDATDPAKPSLVTRITAPEVGNFRVGPVYAAGNYLVVAQMDQGTTHFSVLDVGDPKNPFLLTTGQTSDSLYSSLVIGDRIYGAGTNGSYSFVKWSPDAISVVHHDTSGKDRGGYCGYTDGFVICGQSSEGYKKWDVRDEANIKLVGHGTDPAGVGGDFDFATPLGNLVYLGNDHGSGAALIPHAMAADSVPPKVLKVFPNEETKQPPSTRLTVYFSDDIDLDTVTPEHVIVRKNGACEPLAGVFSKSSFNAISFGPQQPLEANATYDVVVPAGGVKDLAGNVIAVGSVARFATGATLDAVVPCPGDGDGASTGNAGGSSAGGTAGAAGAMGLAGGAGAGAGGMLALAGGGAGGAPSSAGATAGTGGGELVAGTGGVAAPLGATTADAPGCGCSVPGQQPLGSGTLMLGGFAWLATLRARLRRRSRRASRA